MQGRVSAVTGCVDVRAASDQLSNQIDAGIVRCQVQEGTSGLGPPVHVATALQISVDVVPSNTMPADAQQSVKCHLPGF
jgi:hypothetical protein